MLRSRIILIGCGLVVGLLTLAGCGGLYDLLYLDFLLTQSEIAATEAEWAAANPNYLYTLTASEGTLVSNNDDAEDYTLTLGGLIGNVISFTDRPDRIADHESMAEFVNDWDQRGFADDPPNAALVLHEEGESQDVLVVELRDPVYDANADTLVFAITILTDEQTGALAEYSEKADAALPVAFDTCSLLIDDAPRGCDIQLILDVYQASDMIVINNIWKQGNPVPDSYMMQGYDETTDLGDSVTRFTINKYSSPPSIVTINFVGGFDMCNFELSAFLDPDGPPSGFTREGTWTAPYNTPLWAW